MERQMTELEYLEKEKLATERHEYVDGNIHLMAASSKQHNRIVGNIFMQLETIANDLHCEVFFSDIKIRIAKRKTYYYPDVVVGCAEDDDADDYYLEKPCLIVEVTSASTLRKDYLEKALVYQSIPSLQAYLIVAQDKPQVDMLVRDAEGGWELQQFDRLEDAITLPCLEITLNLADIYAGVKLPEGWLD